MSASASQIGRIRFADFEVDLQSQELFRNGTPVRLPNQSFLALAALLERPGQLVTREELRSRLWPDKRVVEFEQGLNAIMNRLREALGDSADSPKFVETLPRRGYRFVGTPAAAEPAVASPESPPQPIPYGIRLAAAAVIALVALGITLAAQRWLTRVETVATGNSPTAAPLTTLVGQEHLPALSPDGTRMLFAWESEPGSGFDLYIRPVDSERLTRLTHSPAPAIAGAWSPDGARIAFARSGDGGLFVIDATGGDERKLAAGAMTQESLMQPAWSPDGRTLAFSSVNPAGSHELRLLDVASLAVRPLSRAPDCWHAGAAAFSADGRQLAFLCTTSVAVYGVYLAGTAPESEPRQVARFRGLPQGLAWRDPAHLLVANDSGDGTGVWTLGLDGARELTASAQDSLAPGLAAGPGRVVYARARQVIDIWRLPLRDPAANARRWIYSTRAQLTPNYSPDGSRIAFQSDRSGNPEIWIADADGGNAVRLTSFDGPLTGGPAWCSDGRRLAFDSRESGTSAIYVVDTLERVPRRVPSSQANLALPAWSADCRHLLASDGREALYRVSAEGGEAQRFTPQRSYQAAVAGGRVIFNVAEPGGVALWSKPFEGGDEGPLPGMPRMAYADSWAANDRAVYFTDTSQVPVVVRRYDLSRRRVEDAGTLPNTPTPLGGLGLAVSADDESLLYTHTQDTQSDLMLVRLDAARQ
jgi:Tol biopolymer transport system component/DNA-binding winged helix-turn-helix (wHTH) protein